MKTVAAFINQFSNSIPLLLMLAVLAFSGAWLRWKAVYFTVRYGQSPEGLASFFALAPSGVFPWGTLLVNVLGCFLMATAFYIRQKMPQLAGWQEIFYITFTAGFCGSLTTFSTFAFELFRYLETGRNLVALVYLFISLAGGLGAVYIARSIILRAAG